MSSLFSCFFLSRGASFNTFDFFYEEISRDLFDALLSVTHNILISSFFFCSRRDARRLACLDPLISLATACIRAGTARIQKELRIERTAGSLQGDEIGD